MRKLIALALLVSFITPAAAYYPHGKLSAQEKRHDYYQRMKAKRAMNAAEARANAEDVAMTASKAHADRTKDQMRDVLNKMSKGKSGIQQ